MWIIYLQLLYIYKVFHFLLSRNDWKSYTLQEGGREGATDLIFKDID